MCKVLDTVVLDRDLPEHGLRNGDLGAVVQVYEPDGLEVEFVTASGKTQALVTLTSRTCGPCKTAISSLSGPSLNLSCVQQDEAHFRKYAKQFFGLEKPEDITLAWERAKIFLLPVDFTWPDASTLKAQKGFLKEGVEMGMFPKEAGDLIDGMYAP